MKKNKILVLLALAPVVLAGCANKSKATGVFTVCIASAPGTIDPALNTTVDGGTYDEHLFEGLYRWSYTGNYPDGSVELVPGLAKAAPTEVTDAAGHVKLTYTLRDGLKWSDGSALTASDLVRSWKRAVSKPTASDYNYLFEAIVGGADAEGESDGNSLSVSASDDKTFVVTLVNKISYWNELTAFPTFAPVPSTADSKGEWANAKNSGSFVCNGPMMLKAYDSSKIEMVPNPYYYNTDIVKAEDIKFAFSDDSTAMLNSYKAGSYDFIDDVPVSLMDTLKATYPTEFFNVGQLGTYYLCWNVDKNLDATHLATEAAREKFRHALALLVDRQDIIDNVAKNGAIAADGFVSKGLTGANGKGDWTDTNGPKEDGAGWYDASSSAYTGNVSEAVEILKGLGYTYDSAAKKFTDIPTVEYLYNTSDGHKAIAEAIQSSYAAIGVNITLKNQDWATFVDTRKNGNFTFARNGWLCDYNDPISMLDMWISTSGNDDVQLGKGDNASYAGYSVDMNGDGTISTEESNLTWANSYDKIITKIKTTTDETMRFKLLHAAETEIMSTWALCPVYYYTDTFMKKESMNGFFAMPLGYKFFYGISTVSASGSTSI
jgi:ABC-type oligopeptide transport system substrate-binding subunit